MDPILPQTPVPVNQMPVPAPNVPQEQPLVIHEEIPSRGNSKPKKPFLILLTIFFLVGIITAGGYFVYQQNSNFQVLSIPDAVTTPSPHPTTNTQDETATWKKYQIQNAGLFFKAPQNMNVNITDSAITVQDYPFNAPPPDKYYKVIIKITNGKIGESKTLPENKENRIITESILATFNFE